MDCIVQENKDVSLDKIENLKKDIEAMPKINHIEILRIFKKHKTQINENQNGVFINMSELSNVIIDELHKYVGYVNSQQEKLSQQEKVKEKFTKRYFNKDNKDTTQIDVDE